MRSIEHNGHKFEYDEKVINSYESHKAMALSEEDPAALYRMYSALFCGNDVAYAQKLGGGGEDFRGLVFAVIRNEQTAKN